MIYLNAFMGAFLVVLIGGVFFDGIVWLVLDALHASKSVIISSEVLALIPLAFLFVVIFKNAISTERDMQDGNL